MRFRDPAPAEIESFDGILPTLRAVDPGRGNRGEDDGAVLADGNSGRAEQCAGDDAATIIRCPSRVGTDLQR